MHWLIIRTGGRGVHHADFHWSLLCGWWWLGTALVPPRPLRLHRILHRLDHASFAWRTHSITSPASASRFAGTSRPSALAVLRLMVNPIFVICWTGKSTGFSPLRMRPV